MPTPENTEEVIEKRDSSPVATGCVILTFAGLLAAIALQVTEVAEARRGYNERELQMTGIERAGRDLRKLQDATKKAIDDNAIADTEKQFLQSIVNGEQGAPGTFWKEGVNPEALNTTPGTAPAGGGTSAIPEPPSTADEIDTSGFDLLESLEIDTDSTDANN